MRTETRRFKRLTNAFSERIGRHARMAAPSPSATTSRVRGVLPLGAGDGGLAGDALRDMAPIARLTLKPGPRARHRERNPNRDAANYRRRDASTPTQPPSVANPWSALEDERFPVRTRRVTAAVRCP